jgi:hypothetical protein
MSDGSSMLARTWVIAARFHEPSDYGIPEAPVLPPVACEPGVLSLGDPDADADAVVLTSGEPMRVRR